MAQKTPPIRDPWKDLSRARENAQVELEEVLRRFEVEENSVQAIKKALLARVSQITRSQ